MKAAPPLLLLTTVYCLHSSLQVSVKMLQQRADGHRRGLGAERAAAERDDVPAARARELYLVILPTALGADEGRRVRGRRVAARQFVQSEAAALREHHAEGVFAGLGADEGLERGGLCDGGDARAARLLGGFEREAVPTFDALRGVAFVARAHVRALRQKGLDEGDAQLR